MKTPKTTLRQKVTAFTLIELLVVISIIAVLAALALPAVTGALAKGQITQTTSNYRQLYVLTQSASLDSQQGGGAGAFPGDVGGADAWKTNLVPNYCSSNTYTSLITVKGQTTNTMVNTNVTANIEPSTVFVYTVGLVSGTPITMDGSGPYGTKGGSLVTANGSAISLTGTNSPILTNGTITLTNAGVTVTP